MDIISLLAVATAAFLFAGTVKGLVGMGLPTAAIGTMTLLIEPRLAVAIIILPMIVSNAWQVYRMGHIRRTLWRYRWFMLISMVVVFGTLLASAEVSDNVLYGVAGTIILIFVATNLGPKPPRLPERLDSIGQFIFGILAGIAGGLTAMWAPPIAIYLMMRDADKDEFVRGSGLLIFMASIPLAVGYLQIGQLPRGVALISALMIVPTLLGFSLGEKLRGHLSPARFRIALLVVFFFLGLNLLRRAFF
ncbi:MAG: sulfite exporter TauE/SafE family protein [Paracoccaceae bacterium]|nr:sulfite exporter TauE/SafE family protein [Paracoccaceae bacterium]